MYADLNESTSKRHSKGKRPCRVKGTSTRQGQDTSVLRAEVTIVAAGRLTRSRWRSQRDFHTTILRPARCRRIRSYGLTFPTVIGGTLFGLLGIILAVPATAILQVILRRWHYAWQVTWSLEE